MAIVKATKAVIDKAMRETDWDRVDALTDLDIERAVAADPEAAPIMVSAARAAALLAETRARLGLSQEAFAARYLIPVGTLRDWEQRRKTPDNAAWAYIRVIAREPEAAARALTREPEQATAD